jgi:hypothetical protein
MTFTTHTGEVVTGERLSIALAAVADDKIALAYAIKEENAYAAHVTEEQKEQNLINSLQWAEGIRNGQVRSFHCWQNINTKLTGECIGFLPKK